MALDGVIFDLDGTLIDTNDAHVEAWRRAFRECGYNIPRDRIEMEIGKGGDRLIPSILGETAAREDGRRLREASAKEFLDIAGRTRFNLFPGARELTHELRSRGLKTVLATSSGEEHIEATEKSAGIRLRDLVDVMVTADDAGSTKPSPEIVVAAYEKLDLSPAQCAMVGDTIYDALACRRAGVVMLGVLTGFNTSGMLLSAGARHVWRDTAHLRAGLDKALHIAAPGSVRLDQAMMERLMREALAEARRGMQRGEAPIGSVLARGDGRIIGRGHNRLRETGDRVAHAELVAFADAAGDVPADARDLILVSTLEPCVMCTGAAMEAAVDVIIYGLRAPADSGTGRVRAPQSPENQMPRIVGEVLAGESRKLFEEWLRDHANPEQRPYVEQLLTLT